jgi:hypothetical protein
LITIPLTAERTQPLLVILSLSVRLAVILTPIATGSDCPLTDLQRSSNAKGDRALFITTLEFLLVVPLRYNTAVFFATMMSAPDRVQVDHAGAQGSIMAPDRSNSIGSTEAVALVEHSILASGGASLVDQAGVRLATPSPPPASFRGTAAGGTVMIGGVAIGASGEATSLQSLSSNNILSLHQERLFHQPTSAVEAVLAASCEAMGFDIAEMWLRTGPKTHQLINSHLRPSSLEDSVRNELMDVYYGTRSSERTHRLSPALCKRAKEAMDVVWVTAHTLHEAEALKVSISDVRTAVAVPVCHEQSNTNLTVIYFSVRR